MTIYILDQVKRKWTGSVPEVNQMWVGSGFFYSCLWDKVITNLNKKVNTCNCMHLVMTREELTSLALFITKHLILRDLLWKLKIEMHLFVKDTWFLSIVTRNLDFRLGDILIWKLRTVHSIARCSKC